MTKLTKGQLKFLKAIGEGEHYSAHVSVMRPMLEGGYIFPRPGNLMAWLVGCNSHYAPEWYLLPAGKEALNG